MIMDIDLREKDTFKNNSAASTASENDLKGLCMEYYRCGHFIEMMLGLFQTIEE